MAEETALKRAWSLIMGTTENSAEGAPFRVVLLLVLLAGIALSGYTIFQNWEYVPPEALEAERQIPAADIRRLEAMIKNLNAANFARMHSMEVVTSASAMARYPFVAERFSVATNNVDLEKIVSQVVVTPPNVRIRATLIDGKSAAAVLDIEGEPDGKIYKVGNSFADKKGRISRISPEKVTIVYENKEFTYTP